jgi:hypothetical protein
MLLKISLASSGVIGAVREPVEESEAVDSVREDDPDDFGGLLGRLLNIGCPIAKGMYTSLTRAKSEAYALSDAKSSWRACCLFVKVGGGCWPRDDVEEAASSSIGDKARGDAGRNGKGLDTSPSSGKLSARPLIDGKLLLRI